VAATADGGERTAAISSKETHMTYRHEWSSTESKRQARRRRQPQTTERQVACPRCGRWDWETSVARGLDLGCMQRAAKAA
jgi:hypothetical protein